jgi:Heavy metal binding domain
MTRHWILAAAIAAASTHSEPFELKQDEFDAPAPTSVAEAAKAAGGTATHEGHSDHADAVYACPMHPEVTSATPGTCRKCGMALVKKGGD